MILMNRRVLVLIFCSFGCSVHLLTVFNDFLKFPVQTDIIYDYPGEMVIPEIDIILFNNELLNLTEFYLKNYEEISHLCEYIYEIAKQNIVWNVSQSNICLSLLKSHIENSYYIGKILKVGDIEKLNVESLIYKYKFNEFIRNDLCSVKRYFNAMNTFLRVSCREESKSIKRILVRNIVADDRFCIMHRIYHHFGIRFAHINSSIDPDTLNYKMIEREKGESVFTKLRYRETVIMNSEWPYQTDCRHYHKAKIFSQCLREKTSHLYPGIIQLEDVLEVGQFPSHFKFDDFSSLNGTLARIRNECAQHVKQLQCIEKSYQTYGRSSLEKGSGIGLICLENQADFNVILKTYPKLTFAELLIYVSSILGIWFGISVYGKLMDGFIFPTIPQHFIKCATHKVNSIRNVEMTQISN